MLCLRFVCSADRLRPYRASLPRAQIAASKAFAVSGARSFALSFCPSTPQECEDEDEGSDMKRERSFLLLASLASDALDEVSGISKVCSFV